ncbi:hypothetical protein HK405_014339 [Cladochytrium tenue]|nr:hypothetical protein HK405_014339 [Cladochytrium tenue]
MRTVTENIRLRIIRIMDLALLVTVALIIYAADYTDMSTSKTNARYVASYLMLALSAAPLLSVFSAPVLAARPHAVAILAVQAALLTVKAAYAIYERYNPNNLNGQGYVMGLTYAPEVLCVFLYFLPDWRFLDAFAEDYADAKTSSAAAAIAADAAAGYYDEEHGNSFAMAQSNRH